MLNLIRVSALPSNVMQSASRGALSVPPAEIIEILVYLANNNKVFAERARMTLAGWDEASSRTVAADPQTPKEVLDYLIAPANLRPALLPVLLENTSVSQKALCDLAATGSREIMTVMAKSNRVQRTQAILTALDSNPNRIGGPIAAAPEQLAASPLASAAPAPAPQEVPTPPVAPVSVVSVQSDKAPDEASREQAPDETVTAFLTENASEIAAEGEKAFAPIGEAQDEVSTAEQPAEEAKAVAAAAASSGAATTSTARHAPQKKSFLGAGHEKGSALEKIAKLDVKGRIQLAMKGDREERSLLIRDGTKVVALAVLESPKVTDSEVEKFAGQKNVLEAVLRGITMKRRFMKQYPVIRNLAFNPRSPIDVSLGLMKHLLIQDLKNLAGNKEVSDTVRKLAMKMFRQKLDTASQKK